MAWLFGSAGAGAGAGAGAATATGGAAATTAGTAAITPAFGAGTAGGAIGSAGGAAGSAGALAEGGALAPIGEMGFAGIESAGQGPLGMGAGQGSSLSNQALASQLASSGGINANTQIGRNLGSGGPGSGSGYTGGKGGDSTVGGLNDKGRPSKDTASGALSGGNRGINNFQDVSQGQSGQTLPLGDTGMDAITPEFNRNPTFGEKLSAYANKYVENAPENYANSLLAKRHRQAPLQPGSISASSGYTPASRIGSRQSRRFDPQSYRRTL